jgi:hypothetical protein
MQPSRERRGSGRHVGRSERRDVESASIFLKQRSMRLRSRWSALLCRKRLFATELRRDARFHAGRLDMSADGVAVVSLVGNDSITFNRGQQRLGGATLVHLAAASRKRRGRPSASASRSILVVNPPRQRPRASSSAAPPLPVVAMLVQLSRRQPRATGGHCMTRSHIITAGSLQSRNMVNLPFPVFPEFPSAFH